MTAWLSATPVRLLLMLCALAAPAAAEPAARAVLSPTATIVRDPVQLQIQITDGGTQTAPPQFSVDGLDIRYLGPSNNSSWSFENGRISKSSSLTHIYQVLALRAGTFTIPAVQVEADGRVLRTQPVQLEVQARSASGGSAQPPGQSSSAFAEIVVMKKSAYVGEMVPVEVRLYVDSKIRPELEQMPVLDGDGFTKQKMPQPRREHARRGGRDYEVIVFRTAITPGKAGRISIGPSEVIFLARFQQRQKRGRSLLGDILGEDLFDDPFFAPMQMKRVSAEAAPVELEVKPLPTKGRPPDFSGAIGKFSLAAEGAPPNVKAGDPITMKLTISGRGNFDRLKEPALRDPAGWHAYPATGEFKADDELGISGTKTFELAVIPEVKKTSMPVFDFSYFDPDAANYVTLTSGRLPLEVEGNIARPPVASALDSNAAATPRKAPIASPSTPPPADILGPRYQFGTVRKSFTPLHRQRIFWLAQTVPLAGLLAFAGFRFLRKSEREKRIAELRREALRAGQQVRRADSDAGLYDAAARLVQIETALATGVDPSTVDAPAARASAPLDEETAGDIERIFEARAERLYAGTAADAGTVVPAERERVVAAVERFRRSHEKK